MFDWTMHLIFRSKCINIVSTMAHKHIKGSLLIPTFHYSLSILLNKCLAPTHSCHRLWFKFKSRSEFFSGLNIFFRLRDSRSSHFVILLTVAEHSITSWDAHPTMFFHKSWIKDLQINRLIFFAGLFFSLHLLSPSSTFDHFNYLIIKWRRDSTLKKYRNKCKIPLLCQK